ncbi:cell wall hydrolase [Paracoccus marcusii]|uniref:cell wall hydrolase n=1 Tax=Paracoccus marcusii TaxID=59779 RepID=UPI0032656A97
MWTGKSSSFAAPNGSPDATVRSAHEAVHHGKIAIGPNRIKQAAADPEESGFDHSGLTLEVAIAPLPRPAEVMTFRPTPRPATPAEIVTGAAIPPPPPSLRNASELSCIAVAIYHEARDQEEFGQRAVASVILQRAAIPHRWGDSACENVVPTQFSFMTSHYEYLKIEDTASWEKAVRIAAEVLVNGPLPELRGADHYHATAVSPQWAPKMVRIRSIDDHVFYVDPHSYSAL